MKEIFKPELMKNQNSITKLIIISNLLNLKISTQIRGLKIQIIIYFKVGFF
jgi:hypothetical protein